MTIFKWGRLLGTLGALTILTATLSGAVLTSRANEVLYHAGDVDLSGDIDTTDARLTLQYAVGKLGVDTLFASFADTDGDTTVTTTDARYILQCAVGKMDTIILVTTVQDVQDSINALRAFVTLYGDAFTADSMASLNATITYADTVSQQANTTDEVRSDAIFRMLVALNRLTAIQ